MLKKEMTVRSKHNDLLNYFIIDEQDLSPAYLASCRKFLNSLSGLITKQQANKLFKLQAASAKQSPQLKGIKNYESKRS